MVFSKAKIVDNQPGLVKSLAIDFIKSAICKEAIEGRILADREDIRGWTAVDTTTPRDEQQ